MMRFKTVAGVHTEGSLDRLIVAAAIAVAAAISAAALPVGLFAQETRGEGVLVVSVVNADGESVAADVSVALQLGDGHGGQRRPVTRHAEAGDAARFEGLLGGTYTILANSHQWGRGFETATVAGGETAEVMVTVSRVYHEAPLVLEVAGGVASDFLMAADAVEGDDLRSAGQGGLGDALGDRLGVSSTAYGGSSRPIIRGLGGDRVRILESGVGTGDASASSPDHAPSVEAGLADQVEILRGPATLRYGSSAIGGVVNVEDGRIPRGVPTHGVNGFFSARAGTVDDQTNFAGRLDAGSGNLAFHASGLVRNAGEYAIPGEAEAHHDEQGEEEGMEEEDEGTLHNSGVETSRMALGASYVVDRGFIGVSWSAYDSDYGVPGHAHEEGEEEGMEEEDEDDHGDEEEAGVSVDLQQRRVDMEAEWQLGDNEVVSARVGYADYQHFEVIDEGDEREIETEFYNNEIEGRVELQHSFWGSGSSGSIGFQAGDKDFEPVGNEAFVPPYVTQGWGAFVFETLPVTDQFRMEVGARFEQRINKAPGTERVHSGFSASVGGRLPLTDNFSFLVNASRSAKLPTAEELYADGPHLASLVFETGDATLEPEIGLTFDASLRLTTEGLRGRVNFFTTSFDGFIHQAYTGEEEDHLPVVLWSQAGASFTGVEAQAEYDIYHNHPGARVTLDASMDMVRAENSDTGDPLPRITPTRFGAGLAFESGALAGRFGMRTTAAQDRLADFETETDGFTMFDVRAMYTIISGRMSHGIVLSGRNLTNAEGRMHTSYIKDIAPMRGRDIRLAYQLTF